MKPASDDCIKLVSYMKYLSLKSKIPSSPPRRSKRLQSLNASIDSKTVSNKSDSKKASKKDHNQKDKNKKGKDNNQKDKNKKGKKKTRVDINDDEDHWSDEEGLHWKGPNVVRKDQVINYIMKVSKDPAKYRVVYAPVGDMNEKYPDFSGFVWREFIGKDMLLRFNDLSPEYMQIIDRAPLQKECRIIGANYKAKFNDVIMDEKKYPSVNISPFGKMLPHQLYDCEQGCAIVSILFSFPHHSLQLMTSGTDMELLIHEAEKAFRKVHEHTEQLSSIDDVMFRDVTELIRVFNEKNFLANRNAVYKCSGITMIKIKLLSDSSLKKTRLHKKYKSEIEYLLNFIERGQNFVLQVRMPEGDSNHIIALRKQTNGTLVFVDCACKKFIKATPSSFAAMGYVDVTKAYEIRWGGHKSHIVCDDPRLKNESNVMDYRGQVITTSVRDTAHLDGTSSNKKKKGNNKNKGKGGQKTKK